MFIKNSANSPVLNPGLACVGSTTTTADGRELLARYGIEVGHPFHSLVYYDLRVHWGAEPERSTCERNVAHHRSPRMVIP